MYRINIPKNLEKYESKAQEVSKDLIKNGILTFELLAKSEKNNAIKELYLIYNPHHSDIHIDINFFESNKDIYQLYPSQFTLLGNSMQLFMVFCTQNRSLKIREDLLFFNKNSKIQSKLNSLQKKYQIANEFENEYSEKIEELVLTSDILEEKTVFMDIENLPEFENKLIEVDEQYYRITSRNQGNIKMEIIDFKVSETIVKVGLTFNNSGEKNFMFENIKFKFSDNITEKIIQLETIFKVKKKSSKDLFFEIPVNEIKCFDLRSLKIKVVY